MNSKKILIALCAMLLTGFSNNPKIEFLELPKLPEEHISYLDMLEEVNNKIYQDMQTKQEARYQYLGTFLLTGYDDCYQCQEEFVGTTALGVVPRVNHTIAVDPSVIPLGSWVMINGVEYRAEDVGGGVNGNHIDIFVNSHAETFNDYCNGYADVYLIVD